MPTYALAVSYIDAYKRRGTKSFVLSAIDYPTALTNAGTFVGELANIMMANILKYSVATEVDYSDTLDALANKDEGITISCDLGFGKTAALKIPTPVKSVILGDGSVDLTDAIVTALESTYIAGEVLISDGEVVLDFLSGKLDK